MSRTLLPNDRCLLAPILLTAALLLTGMLFPAAAFSESGPPVQRHVLPNGLVLIVRKYLQPDKAIVGIVADLSAAGLKAD